MTEKPFIDSLQAITTRYLGPTDRRGSRIKATSSAGSITVPVDNRWNQDDNHRQAAQALMNKFGWTAALYMGGMPNSNDRVFVQVAFRSLDEEVSHAMRETSDGRPLGPVKLNRLLARVLSAIR